MSLEYECFSVRTTSSVAMWLWGELLTAARTLTIRVTFRTYFMSSRDWARERPESWVVIVLLGFAYVPIREVSV